MKLQQLTDAGNADTLQDRRRIGDITAMEKSRIGQLAILIVPPAIQSAPDSLHYVDSVE
jgi:hypothetical protein